MYPPSLHIYSELKVKMLVQVEFVTSMNNVARVVFLLTAEVISKIKYYWKNY